MTDHERITDADIYDRDELFGLSRPLFGVKPELVRGALNGIAQNAFTLDEAEDLIKNFLNRKVR